jgi:hypothetical protein
MSAQRGHLLRAAHYVTQVRTRAVELAALRHGMEAKNYRDVHRLPPSFRRQVTDSLPRDSSPWELIRALEAATGCFFDQARALDAELGSAASSALAAKMLAYVRHVQDLVQEEQA